MNLFERILPALTRAKKSTSESGPELNRGYCPCCREEVAFEIRGDWLRDQYFCGACHSIPRQRHMNLILDSFFPDWENASIHESSPSNKFISGWCSHYSNSQFFNGVEEGEIFNGVRCENLEHLTFPDNTFDIFITQDVLEHVFHPERAFSEIMRVVKPGGAHVFTAPKYKGLSKSYPRASLQNGSIDHLLEPVYHGNPIGDGRALVTWDYGDDFECLISKWCNYPTSTYITRDRGLGIDGEFLEVFVTRKITP